MNEKPILNENDVLTILSEKIEETTFLNDAIIYIDEFVRIYKTGI